MEDFHEAIRIYFSAKEWLEMSMEVREKFARYYYIYFSCMKLGITVIMPEFMQRTTAEAKADKCKLCNLQADPLSSVVHKATCSCRKRKDAKKKLVCEVCGRSFKYKRTLFIHERTAILYKCAACAYQTHKRQSYKEHMKLHKICEVYTCEVCHMQFNLLSAYHMHRQVHNEHKCETCHKKFKYKNSLMKHIKVVHCKVKSNKCKLCNYEATHSFDLKKHMYTHTKEKPYCCTLCDYKSTQKNNVRLHLKNKHPHAVPDSLIVNSNYNECIRKVEPVDTQELTCNEYNT